MRDAIEQFRAAIQSAGLTPPEVIEADGKLRRFASNGERGDDAGWYLLYPDGIPAGAFGDWRSGTRETWRADIGRKLSQAEEAAHRARVAEMRRERKAEEARRHAEAAKKATAIWQAAQREPDHPYLTRKRVKATATLREIHADQAAAILGYRPQAKGEPLVGRLLVAPVKIGAKVSTAELIDESGRKSAIFGGAKAGGYWAAQPLPKGDGTGLVLTIAEGVATALSGREATGHLAIAALSSGNLSAVAKAMRERYPAAALVILADLVQATGEPDPHAIEAAQSVGGVVAIPDFGANRPDGATDFNDMAAQCGLEAVGRAIATASAPAKDEPQPGAESPSGDKSGTIPADGKDGKGDKPNTAKALIGLALKNCDLFHDERGDGYAVTPHEGVRRTLKLRGREFRRWLAGTYYITTDKAANNEAIATALTVLEAKATYDGRQLELSNRFAMRDGVIHIDMADPKWRVVKVTANGWEIMDEAPVLFRRYSHQSPLPDPVHGGGLSDLHQHLAVKSDDDKLLLEAFLVASAFANVPRPAITFHGPKGASKTTSARILKSITDPSVTEFVDLGKSPADLAQVLDHHGVPCFDNLTSIPSWAADMLCRAVTGGAFSKRELYSDDADILMMFKRPMIVTGINIPTHAPDLLDRLLLIELEHIQPEKRLDEASFWTRFDADRPTLFGALLDGIAGALRHLPSVKLDRMPRMADFARVACAYAEHTGVGAGKMLDIIMRHTSRQTQEVLDADPVATALREFVQKRGTWTGTTSKLLELLNESQPTPRADGWPRQANSLSRKLNVLHATLSEVGINVRRQKEGSNRDRQVTLESIPDSSSASSASSKSPIHAGSEADDISQAPSAGGKTSSAADDNRADARDTVRNIVREKT